jgi:hypothetical protein
LYIRWQPPWGRIEGEKKIVEAKSKKKKSSQKDVKQVKMLLKGYK